MSCWTHITSCISVDTFTANKNITNEVKKYINAAPEITGSESNADVFVNLSSGYNLSIGDAEYQTCVVISVQGDLRDRMKEQTQEEFDKFLKYIQKKYYVRDYAVNIEEDY